MALEAHHPHPHLQNQLYASFTSKASSAVVTLALLRPSPAATPIDISSPLPIPAGWERCLDLKTGKIFYKRITMSQRNNGKSPKLDLKLNLSPPPRGNPSRRVADDDDSPNRSSSTSPPSSCVSSEAANSPEATSMVLAGCPRCLMYVMLAEDDPKCPRCKSTVLLDFHHDNTTKKSKKS